MIRYFYVPSCKLTSVRKAKKEKLGHSLPREVKTLFFHILGIIIPIDELICFRRVNIPTTNQVNLMSIQDLYKFTLGKAVFFPVRRGCSNFLAGACTGDLKGIK